MPVHNEELYLHAAVGSILKQTLHNFEFLIVDDGSKDRSTDLIRSYNDPRIAFVQNEQNGGTVHVLNQRIASARGEHIVRMDCDDISLPDRIEDLVRFMDIHHDVGIAGSAMRLIKKGKLKNTRYQPDPAEELKITLLFNTCFFHPTVIMRSCIVKDHPYPDSLVLYPGHLWTQIAKHTKFANIDKTLLYFREHSRQISNRKKETPNHREWESCSEKRSEKSDLWQDAHCPAVEQACFTMSFSGDKHALTAKFKGLLCQQFVKKRLIRVSNDSAGIIRKPGYQLIVFPFILAHRHHYVVFITKPVKKLLLIVRIKLKASYP